MLATPSTLATTWDTNWYPNSSATNHLTLDGNKLMISLEYLGPERVHMGDGTCLSIKQVGHSLFTSPSFSKIISFN